MTEGNEPARHPRAHRADRPDRLAQASRVHGGLFVFRLPDRAQRRHRARLLARGPGRCPAAAAGHGAAAPGPWPPPRARSASPSSRPAPTTAPRSPSTAPPPRAAASGPGAPTSPRGPRRRPASRSARPGRASARSAPSTAGPSAPAAPRRPAPACSPNPGDLIVWGGRAHRHRGVRRRRRLDPHDRGQLLQRRLAAHLRPRRRRRHGLRAARLSPARAERRAAVLDERSRGGVGHRHVAEHPHDQDDEHPGAQGVDMGQASPAPSAGTPRAWSCVRPPARSSTTSTAP